MKWTKAELLKLGDSSVTVDEDIQFDDDAFEDNHLLRSVKDVHVSGSGSFETGSDLFAFDLEVSGTMICPCAITNEDVEVPFDTCSHEVFSFENDDDIDIHVVKNDIIELLPIVYQIIELEVPFSVVKEDIKDYPKGDGWRVITEEEYERSKEDQIDPRLAKLKEFKIKDDD